MARQYAKLYVSVWSSDFKALSREAQHLYFLLLSNPKLSAAGCVTSQPRKWARYSEGSTEDAIKDALQQLCDHRYTLRDDDTDEVLIRSFIRHDRGYRNQFLRKSIETAVDNIESPVLRRVAALELASAVEDAASPQVEESEQDPYEDPLEDAYEDTTEANYRLTPSTGELSPSSVTAVAQVSDTPDSVPATSDDDKVIIDRIIERCATIRTERARPGNTIAYRATVLADIRANERDAIAAVLQRDPAYRALHDKAAAYYELARQQKAG